ncbi:MAG: hypothetical protein JJU05_10060 [Verrucomicrobia bacterium]|nr:hypothetical protein [Verrucomicrobiota bacterium]MCH8526632.1 hypothetical protein [Kiritimatiellia bacterium]
MSFRSILLGFLLGLFMATFTYFNDQVVENTFLIGNFLPVGVFGAVLLLLMLVNPLLASVRASWALKGGEIAIITAMGLAACAWPGSNFFRVSTGVTAMPRHLIHFNSSWQSNHLMSYVPGASDELAQGHVTDWRHFAGVIRDADAGSATPAGTLKSWMLPEERGEFSRAAEMELVSANAARQMTMTLNRLLGLGARWDSTVLAGESGDSSEGLSETARLSLNRRRLVQAFPDLVLPPPRGLPILLDVREHRETALTPLLEGRPPDARLSVFQLPWRVWAPTIRVWGTVVLALGLATVCMALIVHRQWANNELLPYPVARFLEETLDRPDGQRWPRILHNKFFWIGFGLIFLFHLQNGIATWFEVIPSFPNRIDFSPLATLFPNARRVPRAMQGLFSFGVIPSVIAFAFFLDSRTSLSLGLTNLFWTMFGSVLIANGVMVGSSYMGGENGPLLRFGAFLGFGLMILYTGRRYYREALLETVGCKGSRPLPGYVAWAGRGMALGVGLSIYGLHAAGLNFFWSLILTAVCLNVFLVMGRIVAETGAFFLQPQWLPIGVFTTLFGMEAIGPTPYIVMALSSALLVGDPRTTLMPFLLNGLKLGDVAANKDKPATGRLGILLLLVVAGSFVAAGATTLWFQYNRGVSGDIWANQSLPAMSFFNLDRVVGELTAGGELSAVTQNTANRAVPVPSPDKGAVMWLLLGGALVLIFAIARLRLTWWPFHPVIFLIWGTYPMGLFGGSFFLGWLIKEGVVKTFGTRGFHLLKPLMVGIISAEVLSAILWGVVSWIYYLNTGRPPITYRIFPA